MYTDQSGEFVFGYWGRRNLTPVSNVFEAAPISLFWAPGGLNKLPEVCFEFPFNLIGKSTMTFSLANHGAFSNPGTQVGAQNEDFRAVSRTDLTSV